MRNLALLLLVLAVFHETAWLAFAPEIQGDVRYVTAWPLVCALCLLAHQWRDRFLSAVSAAVVVMTSTTAGCSAYWLATRFQIPPGHDSCSKEWGFPVMLLSCLAALAVFWAWGAKKK